MPAGFPCWGPNIIEQKRCVFTFPVRINLWPWAKSSECLLPAFARGRFFGNILVVSTTRITCSFKMKCSRRIYANTRVFILPHSGFQVLPVEVTSINISGCPSGCINSGAMYDWHYNKHFHAAFLRFTDFVFIGYFSMTPLVRYSKGLSQLKPVIIQSNVILAVLSQPIDPQWGNPWRK